MKSFEGKVAAITGAASGIGRALALELARQGCHLALSDVDAQGLKHTAAEARRYGGRVMTTSVDVADRQQIHAWADAIVREQGGVNLVINNAGVAHSATIDATSYEDFGWIMGINFWGVVYGTKAFLPHLKASGDGHIVNISSIFGLFAQPGMSTYNASKFAVRGYTESLRQELDLMRCGVSATCVHPGGIKTNIAKSSRISDSLEGFLVADGARARQDFEKLFITKPEGAARAILAGVRRNARRVLIGPDARAADGLQRLLPAAYQAVIGAAARRALA
ncbi:MAG TPA: SDR family NAD(P)-dependent oxidoreductase [Solimonas sp.]